MRLYREVADGAWVPQRHVVTVTVPSPGWARAGAVGPSPSQSPASDSEAESARCPADSFESAALSRSLAVQGTVRRAGSAIHIQVKRPGPACSGRGRRRRSLARLRRQRPGGRLGMARAATAATTGEGGTDGPYPSRTVQQPGTQ